MNAYLVLKSIHVNSAAVLLGTGAGIAFNTWMGWRLALRTGSIETLRNAALAAPDMQCLLSWFARRFRIWLLLGSRLSRW